MKSIALGLLLATSTIAVAADAPASRPARDDSASEKLGLKLGLQCYTFRMLSFFETVDKAAQLGIKYLEIYPGQTLKPGSKSKTSMASLTDEEIAEIKKKLADAGGLKVVCYGVAGVPTDEAGARKMFEWAKKLGIEVLVTETTPTAVHDKLCDEFGIRMALHNHPSSWPPDKVLAATKDRSKLIGACADTGHWLRGKPPRLPVETLKSLEGRIMSLHFKDLDDKRGDVPFGTGIGDAKGQLAELARQGFKGYACIEYERGGVPELMANLAKCAEFYDKTCAELAK